MAFVKIRDLLGMIKFSHTLFALPFALLGAAMAAKSLDSGEAEGRLQRLIKVSNDQ